MIKRRSRRKQTMPLDARLAQFADAARSAEAKLPPGQERDDMMQRRMKVEQAQWFANLFKPAT